MKKYLFLITLLVTSLMATSCHEEDFGYTSFEIAYKTNFEKQYGKIKPDQTWDFSSHNLRKLGLVGGPSYAAMTRATPGVDEPYPLDYIVFYPNHDQMPGFAQNATKGENGANSADGIGGYSGNKMSYQYKDLDTWLGEQPAGSGDQVVFQKPTNNFTVIPFNDKTGNDAIGTWELHLVDMGNGFDYTISDNSKINGPIVIKPDYIQGNFYFYIKYGSTKDENLALFPGASEKKSLVIAGNPTVVLGCECGVGGKDYKDMGILIVVPQNQIVPPPVVPDPDPDDPEPDDPEPEDPEPEDPPTLHIITDISKKYMIEDRGSTADFDFNDIVVVVRYYKDVDMADFSTIEEYTRAKLVYLCGTIPFTLTIGGQSFGQMEGRVNYVPYSQDGYGELASENGVVIQNNRTIYDNDIKVTVENGETSLTYDFPETGDMPLMIAVDPSVECMPENQSVYQTWFETNVKNPQQEVVVREQP